MTSTVRWNEQTQDNIMVTREVAYDNPQTAELVARALPSTAHVDNVRVIHDPALPKENK